FQLAMLCLIVTLVVTSTASAEDNYRTECMRLCWKKNLLCDYLCEHEVLGLALVRCRITCIKASDYCADTCLL
ncbi:hypothetical protein LSAT2_026398, partial [Lamellibrachia satsuma]